jgi:hypothetical protein
VWFLASFLPPVTTRIRELPPSVPKDALTLSDVRAPTLTVVCEPCGRRGRYAVARLVEKHGDMRLTDFLQTLADCPEARSASVYDRCRAVYEGLMAG